MLVADKFSTGKPISTMALYMPYVAVGLCIHELEEKNGLWWFLKGAMYYENDVYFLAVYMRHLVELD